MPTVIKRESLSMGRLQSFNLNDIEAEGRRTMAAARKQAETVLSGAHAEAARIREAAGCGGREEGFAQGLEEGRRAGQEEAFRQAAARFAEQQAGVVEACRRAITEFNEQKSRLHAAARADVLKLAVTIARRVVKCVEAVRPLAEAAAAANAAEALELIGPQTDAVVRVNPADRQAIETFAATVLQAAQEGRHVTVLADESVAPGGCILTTAEGQVDATLDKQVDRIAELLIGDVAGTAGSETRE